MRALVKETKNTRVRILVAVLVAVLAALPWKPVFAAAFLTLKSFSGHSNSIQVSGGGFTAGEKIDLYVGASTPAMTVTADKNSLFGPVNIPLAPDAPQGQLQISAVGQTSGLTAANAFYVTPFVPVLNVSSSGNTPGSVVTISGSGFAPSESLNIFFGQAQVATAKADSKGNLGKTAFNIPNVSPETYDVRAVGASSGAVTSSYFYVGGFYPSANPSSYFLNPDQAIYFSGYGFAPGERVEVWVGEDAAPVNTIVADSGGKFVNAYGFLIPPGFAGSDRTVELKGLTTGVNIPFEITIGSYDALVSPDNYFVAPGKQVKFYGRNFAPNETVQIFIGENASSMTSVKADKNGGFAGAGLTTVPYSASGTQVAFRFVGQHSNAAAETSVQVGKFTPQITPSEYHLTPGKSFTVWGTGFAPSEKVDVTAASGTVFTVTTDKFGVFKTSGPFAAPLTQNSPINVSAVGQSSGAQATLALKTSVLTPLIIPASYYILPGDSVNVGGYGFAPGENVMPQNNSASSTVIKTDKYGNFDKYLVDMPFQSGRQVTYSFAGAISGAAASTVLNTADLTPVLALSSYYAQPGSSIKAQATGFSRGEPLTVRVGPRMFSVSADNNGTTPWFFVSLPLDRSASSTDIAVTGNATGASATVSVSMAPFNPQVNPGGVYYTTPGTQVKFYGKDFAPFEDISISLNGEKVATTTSDIGGGFITPNITIPLTAKSAKFAFSGAFSQQPAVVNISLQPFNPQVYPSSYYVRPGSVITLNGGGFAPKETVNIVMDGNPLPSVVTDNKGNFVSGQITVPFGINQASFTVSGASSEASTKLVVIVAKLQPAIALSAYYGPGGQPLTVTGFGFGANEKVDVVFDGTALGSVSTTASGDFTLKANLPSGGSGDKEVKVVGEKSGAVVIVEYVMSAPVNP